MQCTICGGTGFTSKPVLWPELIDDWQLSTLEAAYVDRQQGEICNGCGANMRSIALSSALLSAFAVGDRLLSAAVVNRRLDSLRILEINEAGTLTPMLRKLSGYVFGAYPQLDMHALPFGAEAFDVVVHSDTLEHVPNPVHALSECRRVLKPGGALCLTVPIIVGRMSRDRHGLRPSYHGRADLAQRDMMVQTEFGADAWTYVMQAGFDNVSMHSVDYPVAIAMCARKV